MKIERKIYLIKNTKLLNFRFQKQRRDFWTIRRNETITGGFSNTEIKLCP